MTTKEQILQVIEQLPDDATFDQAIEKLNLLRKIEIGLAQADRGEVVDHAEIKRRFLGSER